MAINYTQTDNAATHDVQACSNDGGVGNLTAAKEMSNGGTAGTVEETARMASGDVNQRCIMIETPAVGFTDWASGNYTVRLNVTTAGALTWTKCFVCRVNSSGVNQATIGSDQAVGISMNSAGIKTVTISGAAQTAADTDRVYIVCVFDGPGGHGNTQFGWTPNQNIDTPITPPPATFINNDYYWRQLMAGGRM